MQTSGKLADPRGIRGWLCPHCGIIAVVAIFVCLATFDNFVTPPFEAGDEHQHYAYARYLVREHALPPQDGAITGFGPEHEASQPPLYYVLAALATWQMDDADQVDGALYRNPHFAFVSPGEWPDNKNTWLRSPSVGEISQDFLRAVHMARGVSTLLGAVAIVGVYGLALMVFDGDAFWATIASAWLAFNPQFAFISGVVSNDSTAAALATLVLWVTCAWMIRGPNPRRAASWGVLTGLAVLTKASVLGIVPVCIIGFFAGVRRLRAKDVVGYAGVVAGLTVLIGGWWYVRNAVLLGDPLNIGVHLESQWSRAEPAPFVAQLHWVINYQWTYWVAYGWGGVQPVPWLYTIVVAWNCIGFAGVVPAIARFRTSMGRRLPLVGLLILWFLTCLLAFLWWMRTMTMGVGRLMFPAAGSISILLVLGWRGWLPERWQRWIIAAMTLGLLVVAIICPLVYLRPAVSRPPQLTTNRIQQLSTKPAITYGGAIRLFSAEVGPQPVYAGEWTWVRLCYESLKPIDRDYEVFVHFVGPGNQLVAVRHTHTGLGRFPTSAWSPGDAFCDVVRLRVEDWAQSPAVYDVEVGFIEPTSRTLLGAVNERGERIGLSLVERVKVHPLIPVQYQVPNSVNYLLDDQISLVGYDVIPSCTDSGISIGITIY
ncbi:MAG: hypothetical protein MUQ10_17920, partial [Anaerolineae bacterium]|nr:hypothetical protein [Anaerolineae bacterium]